ncbi:MAG: TolC family protein, partial [Lentisphaeria bacterium]|nr:TolC family protein [Lentisphaeria bacterium]
IKLYYSGSFSNNNFRYAGYRYNASRYNHIDNSYGAVMEWNLFEGFASYNLLRERKSLEETAQYNLQERFLQVIREVSDARENIINASGQLELYRQSLEWVFEQRQLVQAEYNAAKATITRLNGAQSDLIRAENMLAIAQIELNKAIVQLQSAIEGDYTNLPENKIIKPAIMATFDKLLQQLTGKFKEIPANKPIR